MTIQLKVPSMACGACAETITKAVLGVDPQAVVVADPQTKAVSVTTQADEETVKAAIATAGYPIE